MKTTSSSRYPPLLCQISKLFSINFKVEIRQNTDKCFCFRESSRFEENLSKDNKNYKKGENHCLKPNKKKNRIFVLFFLGKCEKDKEEEKRTRKQKKKERERVMIMEMEEEERSY